MRGIRGAEAKEEKSAQSFKAGEIPRLLGGRGPVEARSRATRQPRYLGSSGDWRWQNRRTRKKWPRAFFIATGAVIEQKLPGYICSTKSQEECSAKRRIQKHCGNLSISESEGGAAALSLMARGRSTSCNSRSRSPRVVVVILVTSSRSSQEQWKYSQQ